MNTEESIIPAEKEDGTKKLLMVIITLVFLGLLLFAVSFFLYDHLHGKRADQITYRCDELTGFEWIRDKERVPVDFPCDLNIPKGSDFVCEAKLPDEINDDTWICYASGKDTGIYIDGKLRKNFERSRDTIAGGAVKSLFLFVELFPEDAGRTIRIVKSGISDNGVSLKKVYIGTSLGIIERIISQNIFYFILTVSLMIIALIAILIGILLRFYMRTDTPITSMGVGVLFVTLWLIFDSELYQLAFRNYYIDGTMSFIMMLLVPYPFVYYLDTLQEKRYRTVYAFLLLFLELITICCFLLHFSDTIDFLSMLPFLAAVTGIIILCVIALLIREFITKLYKTYLVSFIGLTGFIISGILEIICILFVDDRYDGSWIIWGLFWTIILAIIHQLTATRKAQKEAAVAVRASETKTNFLANMSHEIRTPMNAILGMDEMILREARNNASITKYASDIKSAGNMLLSIINDILDLSRIESGKAELVPVDFEICSVINDIINIVGKRAADKGIEFELDAAKDIPVRFHGDEIRARQILLNIVNNAVKYTNEGRVSVNVDMQRDGAGKGTEDKGLVTLVITVADTGIGIRKEDIPKLFQPFDRLEETKNRNIEGTGLGLSIAGNYINLMGGHIEVSSEYGKGSIFTVYMPMEVTDATPIGDFNERIRRIRNSGGGNRPMVIAPDATVLIVDDNEMNLEVIEGLLERTRMRIDVAKSGGEGISLMDRRRYDIVFIDQMMPGMDGVTTLSQMRSRFDLRGVSMIVLTADAVAGAREYYLDMGFDDYLSKPVRSEELEEVLKNHLPANLLLSEEDIDRISEAGEKQRREKAKLKKMLVIDPDRNALREVKEKTEGIYKGTFITDMGKAEKYLADHDVDYVLVRRELFIKNPEKAGKTDIPGNGR